MDTWSRLLQPSDLLSPSLVIDRGLVARNLAAMVKMAGDARRLRPHVKTHKMPAIVKLAATYGITKHKAATIAEAEMVAAAGGADVLLAYPIVGPNVARLARLMRAFPETTFRTLVDDPEAASALSAGLGAAGRKVPTLVDLDVGMGRTGIEPCEAAVCLYKRVASLPNLVPDGLSAYDGHIHDVDLTQRRESARAGIERTFALRDRLVALGLPVPRLLLGGTPTFPVHAELQDATVECSPGTSVLHDFSYAAKYPDLPFVPAAALLTRVISRPRPGRLCLDLGHKAVAADPVGPRVLIFGLPDAKLGGQSEEHLVVETAFADDFPPGRTLVAFPAHVCPTCALHSKAYVFENGEQVDEWQVAARDRVLTI